MDVKNYLSDLKKEFSGYNAGKFAKDKKYSRKPHRIFGNMPWEKKQIQTAN